MYTGVCSDVMYVTILAIEYSTQMYQCLKLVVITAQLCSNNNSLQLLLFETVQSVVVLILIPNLKYLHYYYAVLK